MTKIDNPNKKIKIDSALFEEFSSPIVKNPNTYMKVDENGSVIYLTPFEVSQEMGEAAGASISDWNNYTHYNYGQLVIYNNNLYKCNTNDYKVDDEFDFYEWDLIAGYQKESLFFKDDENPMDKIVLDEPISDKSFISINVDGVVLQTDQYVLDEDGKTIHFYDEIPAGSSVNALVYGNASVVRASKTFAKEYVYGTSPEFGIDNEGRVTLDVGVELLSHDLTYINIENSQLLQSQWILDDDSHIITFLNPLENGDRVQVMSWENVELEASVTFTPETKRSEENSYTTILTWKSDNEDLMDSKEPVEIYDGATYVPTTIKEDGRTTITFTNNQTNEEIVSEPIIDGVNYVPTIVEDHDNFVTNITITNDKTLDEQTFKIYDGITYTPHIDTNPDGQTSTIYYTNDQTGEKTESTTFYTKYTKIGSKSFVAENDGQTIYHLDYPIKDKNLLWVNLENSDVLPEAYDLSEDGLDLILKNGDSVKEGDMLNVKYFYNLVVGEPGHTYKPIITQVTNGYELSWTNDGEMENPMSIILKDGKKGNNGDSVVPCGAWDSSKDYDYLSIVTYEDNQYEYGYLCIDVAVAGTPLTDTQFWNQLYKVYKPSYIDGLIENLQNQINEMK